MSLRLEASTRSWPLREPFAIARGVQETADVVVVELHADGAVGRGEAAGVGYHGDTPERMLRQVEGLRPALVQGLDRAGLQALLPAGGARNALDAAFWDLEARRSGVRAWRAAGLAAAGPVTTAVTIGMRDLDGYARAARALADHPWIKVKVAAEDPVAAVAAVRREAPRAQLIVDANQSWDIERLLRLAPELAALGVDLLEQPLPAGGDAALAGYAGPVPVCADESIDTLDDLPAVAERYAFVNIKLDKTGGLTGALELAHAARARGLRLMVGCMVGGSVAMAPAMVLAQLCEVCDLDGPLLQAGDWPGGIVYERGVMQPPWPGFWG